MTGGAGFIGQAVTERLLQAGHEVVIADLVEREHRDARQVRGDLRDHEVVAKAVTPGIDAVVHLAARTSVLESKNDPWGYYTSNVQMTALLLEACRRSGVGAFALASTNAVAGVVEKLPIDELSPLAPLTPYGATKAASEMLCSAYGASFGIATSSVRLTNVYGPGMTEKDSFVPRLMRAAAGGTGVEVYGDGSMLRDYVYIDDVAAAFLLMIEKAHNGPVVIGSGHSIPVNELVDHARKATGVDIPVKYGDSRPGEMPAVVVDIARARSLGFSPKMQMDEGMRQAWATFSERHQRDGDGN